MEKESMHTLLLIDDDGKTLLALKDYLGNQAYRILYTPKGGSEALKLALNEQPTLILLDWVMPDMDGIETLQVLKANPEAAHIPVIMITGMHKEAPHLKQALEIGAVDFLTKPFDPIVLQARMANVIRLTQATQALLKVKEEEKNRLREEVEVKKRTLASQAMHSHELENLLRDVQTYVKKDSWTPEDQKHMSHRINQHLQSNSWDDFKKHFEAVNPDFFQRLQNLEGKALSPAEIKFAAYLRVGLRNTDIASLLGIGKDSISSSLHRMKKKLALTADDSLRDFIQQI